VSLLANDPFTRQRYYPIFRARTSNLRHPLSFWADLDKLADGKREFPKCILSSGKEKGSLGNVIKVRLIENN